MEFLNKFFNFEKRGSNLKIEIIAGITTFLSMSYIICVNPEILSKTGMPRESLVIATCLATAIGTIMVGLIAKVPIAMAPGMGLNAFFAYTLVIGKKVSWETALGMVFLSGLAFFILSVIGIRRRVVKAIPAAIVDATSVGIGLFIAFIGMQNLGIVVDSPDTLVTLGKLEGTVLIGLFGLLLIVILETLKIKGSILIGIVTSTILGIIFKKVQLPTEILNLNFNIAPILLKLDIVGAFKWSLLGSIFSMMFIDMFDSVGTIIACSHEAKLVKKDGTIKKLGTMLTLDAAATMIGALLGTSTTTSYIESAAGIEEGGRTGMTSVVTGLLFLLATPLVPCIAIVPNFATGPALIIVGLFMLRRVKKIDFMNLEEGFPSFVTIMMMPLTYSISTGLAFGFISHTILKAVRGKISEIDPVMWAVTALSIVSLLV